MTTQGSALCSISNESHYISLRHAGWHR